MNVIGIDEVGHGAIAGPVTICAYMSDMQDEALYYKDSKGLNRKSRLYYEPVYRELAKEYYIVSVDNFCIDSTTTLNARNYAIDIALRKFQNPIHKIILDGDHRVSENTAAKYGHILEYMPKADKSVWQCAAASILAKNNRDDVMASLGDQYPVYSWRNNSGYAEPGHIKAIKRFGLSPYHRKSNAAVQAALEMP